MAIKLIVQYNGGFLPDILLWAQALIFVQYGSMTLISFVYYYYLFNFVLHCLLFCYVCSPCMTINVSVQYNGGLLPDIILLAQGYYHRETRLNVM